MTINWGALGVVAAVSLVVAVLVVVLVSLALVGLSAREPDQPGEPADEALVIDRDRSGLSPARGHGVGSGLPSRRGRDSRSTGSTSSPSDPVTRALPGSSSRSWRARVARPASVRTGDRTDW